MEEAIQEKKHLSKDILWNTIGTFSYMFALWLVSIMTTNFLGYEQAGVFSLCLVASNIATSFGSYYVRVYYASDINRRFSDADYIWCRVLTIAVSVLVCGGYALALRYPWEVVGAIMLFYVYKVFELFTDIHSGTFQRYGKMYVCSILTTIKGVLSVAGFFVGAYWLKSLYWGFVFMIGVAGLTWIAELIFMKKLLNIVPNIKEFSIKAIGKLLWVCLPLFIVLLCSNVLPSIPKAMFERMYTTEEFGYYSSIATISVLIQTAAGSVLMPIIPKIASAFQKKDFGSFWKLNGAILGLTVAMGVVAFVMVLFLGDWALKLVYGESILAHSYTFKWTVIAGTFTALFVVGNQLLAAIKDKYGMAVGSIAGTLVCLAISYPLCKYAYMDGISYALIIAEAAEIAIFAGFMIYLVSKKKKEPEEIPSQEI